MDNTRCTCGPFWSVVPPPPCPIHSNFSPRISLNPISPPMTPKDIADMYRRIADAIDPPLREGVAISVTATTDASEALRWDINSLPRNAQDIT